RHLRISEVTGHPARQQPTVSRRVPSVQFRRLPVTVQEELQRHAIILRQANRWVSRGARVTQGAAILDRERQATLTKLPAIKHTTARLRCETQFRQEAPEGKQGNDLDGVGWRSLKQCNRLHQCVVELDLRYRRDEARSQLGQCRGCLEVRNRSSQPVMEIGDVERGESGQVSSTENQVGS